MFNIYFQCRQWICFLRMQHGLISKSAWITNRNVRRGRFAFVDIANGRGWGSQSLILWLFKTNAKFTVMILIARLSQQPATYQQVDSKSETLLQIHILPTNHYSLECPTSLHTSLTHFGTVQYGCLSGGPLICVKDSILFLYFNYTNILYRTVQTHFTIILCIYFH